MNPLLRACSLLYSYPLGKGFQLDIPELIISAGDSIGLVGANGSGKSTLLSILAGILEPLEGRIILNEKVTPLLGVGSSINEDQTGYENILTELQNHLHRDPSDSEYLQTISFTELPESVLSEPLSTYSTGMKARVAFAPLSVITPGILVMDEVLAVGDNKFVPKALSVVESLVQEGNALVLASHSSTAIRSYCKQAIWLNNGSIHLIGDTNHVMDQYDQWCNDVSLQNLVDDNGTLGRLPNLEPVQLFEELNHDRKPVLSIILNPDAFTIVPEYATLKVYTSTSYLLYSDTIKILTQSIISLSVELTYLGTVDLLVELQFRSGSYYHTTVILHPRPHGISRIGGHTVFAPHIQIW